ncbi:MAG TPA: hypothetical protein VGC30_14435 [Dokdonella sp.]
MLVRLHLLACLVLVAAAGSGRADERDDDALIVGSEGFLRAHPDLRFRNAGELAYQGGRYEEALGDFRDAARYGDKPSQAMLAAMLWNGDGVARDRAQAYAWMDLAAERGYRDFAITRERYWLALDDGERKRALELGEAIYAEYGDEVAKPRLNRELRRAMTQVTGSRVGRAGTVVVRVKGPDGRTRPIDGTLYYSPRYWQPEQYWQWQDRMWREPPKAHVEVGPLQPADGAGSR